jgi:nucleoside-diphosphate-sugar epimerase
VSRVLLTGATGFIGRHVLAALLDAGHDVHALSRDEASGAAGAATWHRADLTRAGESERVVAAVAPEALVHMAWYVEHGAYWHARENVVWTEATLRLLREFVAAGGGRAVLAGTCAEYEWSRERYDERTSPLAPATMYGVAKDATRRVAERLLADAGVELAWGRIFMPYGPHEGDRRLLSSVIAALLAGEEVAVSEGTHVRDFIYVEDVARAFAAILGSAVLGPINVATGSGHSIRELVELAAAQIGRPELVRWGSVPPREGDPPRLVADVRRLAEEVGFEPSVGLREGVGRTVAWWRSRPR